MSLLVAPGGGIAHLIQLAVAPVFLLSGVGMTLSVLSSRLARVIDRARAFESEAIRDAAHGAELQSRLDALARRARYISAAITLCTLSAMFVTLTVILLFADDFMRLDLGRAIAIVFVGSMVLLTLALFLFFVEVRIATTSLRIGRRDPL